MVLEKFITERIHITSNSRSATVTPETKGELRSLLHQELKRQGPDADLNFIDVTEVEEMVDLFHYLDIRNIKIDQWDVSNVTNMRNMFSGCEEFNCDLSNWDTSNVTNMEWMFRDCYNFKGTGLEMWNTSNVITMDSMFDGCKKLNVDLSSWNVSKVGPYNTFKLKSGTPPKFNK